MIDNNKVQCPLCNKKATWSYWFFKHFLGAHVKNCSNLEDVEAKIKASIKEKKIDPAKGELILNTLNELGPDAYEIQDDLIQDDCNTKDEKAVPNYCLNEYFGTNDKNPICREERQFALFLANTLKSNNRHLMEMLELDPSKVEILEVYYEATLMRDYWYIDKANFNKRLGNFIENEDNNYNYTDNNVCDHANYWSSDNKHPLACWMMNAKPDLAILYKNLEDQTHILSFIECKYGSKEDKYRGKLAANLIEKTQLEVQNHILDFLCDSKKRTTDKYLKYYDKNVDKGDVKLVKFTSDNLKHSEGNKDYITISIEDLIKHGYK